MSDAIAFTSIPVIDMKRAVRFYRDILGLNLLFERPDWSEFSIGGQRLALKAGKAPQEKDPSTEVVVYLSAHPVEDRVEVLKKRGVRFNGPVKSFPYGKLVQFEDSEGNILGLYECPQKQTEG
jgi:predicted enzyme related to lactoylglutathione lyase